MPTEATASELQIEHGLFHAYFVFDVADTIDLSKLQSQGFEKASINLRAVATPSHIQFHSPPLLIKLPAAVIDDYTADARARVYDYGTVAIRFSFPFAGSWDDFGKFARRWRQNNAVLQAADQTLSDILRQINFAIRKRHEPLMEDYFVYQAEMPRGVTATQLVNDHRSELATLIAGEEGALSQFEQDEILRTRFTYFETDLSVIQWDAALVLDDAEGAEAIENILEFSNTQLVELRTYDARLDGELDAIYRWEMVHGKSPSALKRRSVLQQTDRLRTLLVDMRELADRSSNALKIMGDAYYARLYRGTALRLGLPDWQQQLDSKFASVSETYRFANDQAQHAQSEFLEIIVIILIAVEIALAVFSMRHP